MEIVVLAKRGPNESYRSPCETGEYINMAGGILCLLLLKRSNVGRKQVVCLIPHIR